VSLVLVSVFVFYKWSDRQTIKHILNVSSLPRSLSVVGCESPFTTDVLITCVVNIDPIEFSSLLGGYEYKWSAVSKTSYEVVGPRIGNEFSIANLYSVEPPGFEHGGFVRVYSDKSKSLVLLDLYIE